MLWLASFFHAYRKHKWLIEAGPTSAPMYLMPGMKIMDIRFSDLERKDLVKAWLQQQLASLS